MSIKFMYSGWVGTAAGQRGTRTLQKSSQNIKIYTDNNLRPEAENGEYSPRKKVG